MRQQILNAAHERRNSRAQFLLQQQQQQLKQQQNIYIAAGRKPSISSNFHLTPAQIPGTQLLPKELWGGETFVKQSTPVLFLTNKQGLHLRTFTKERLQELPFNVRCCDLERWNSKPAPVIPSKEVENGNAQHVFEMQRIKTNFPHNRLHHYHTNINNNNNALQKRTCVIL